MNRRAFLRTGLVLSAAGLSSRIQRSEASPQDGAVVVALGSDIDTIDPHKIGARVGFLVREQIFEPLLTRSLPDMKPVPHLVTNVQSLSPQVWELTLRRDVKFHNGEPFTAATVKANFERILDPQAKVPYRGTFTWIDRVEVVDSAKVRLHTKTVYPIVHEALTFAYMMPTDYLKKVGDAGFVEHPVGSGPFKYREWVRGQRVVLEANESYWKGAPGLKRIIFRPIPEVTTQIAELLAGNVHLIKTVPPDQLEVLRQSPRVMAKQNQMLRVDFIKIDGGGRAGQTPLMDVRVRRAMSHAVDVDAMMRSVLKGLAVRSHTGLSPLTFGYDGSLEPPRYDPERAKRLMAEAGQAAGFEIEFVTYSGSAMSVSQIADAISGYLGAIGIRTRRRHFENTGQWLAYERGGKAGGITLYSWGSLSIFDADTLLHPLLHSKEPLAYNATPAMDDVLTRARSTLDAGERRRLYREAQKIILDQAYWIPLWAHMEVEAMDRRLDYTPSADGLMRVHLARWRA